MLSVFAKVKFLKTFYIWILPRVESSSHDHSLLFVYVGTHTSRDSTYAVYLGHAAT